MTSNSRHLCKSLPTLLALTLLAFVASACAIADPQPLQFGEAVWLDGESSRYEVSDLYGDFAGAVQWEMSAPDKGVWRLVRTTDTQGDHEDFSIDMAAQGYRPFSSRLERTTSEGAEVVSSVWDRSKVSLTLTTNQDVTTYEDVTVPSDSRDARALFMLVRTLPLEKGYSTRINTFLPVASRMLRIDVRVTGREEVTVPAGTYTTWEVEMDEGDRTSKAWIATEAPYQLVKYEDAANGGVFELSDYEIGQ